MDYLSNTFNYSINPAPNDGVAGLFNLISMFVFYYMISEVGSHLQYIEIQSRTDSDNKQAGYDTEEFDSEIFENVFEDATVDEKVKIELAHLLDINSLNRHYILYYIFKMNNGFNYRQIARVWDTIEYCEGAMTLDETLECNHQLVIGNTVRDCNISHVRFLSWIYYSGIWDFLIGCNNSDSDSDSYSNSEYLKLKKDVLDIMNSQNLLTGNLFLKYQLYLVELENMEEQETLDTILEEDTLNQLEAPEQRKIGEIGEIDEIKDAARESDSGQDVEDTENVEDTEGNNDGANENELSFRPITEDLADMNEATFALKLLAAVRNITIRSLRYTWGIIKEEAAELFHPLG